MMKKTILLVMLFFFTSCGTSPAQENANTVLSTIPSFMDNNNGAFPAVDQNNNSMVAIENTNQNMESTENINAVMDPSLPMNTNANRAPVHSVQVHLLALHEVSFDCQPLSIYEKADFYPDFLQQFESLYRYSATDINNMMMSVSSEQEKQEIAQKATVRETQDHITSSCLSKDGTLFLVLVEGDQGGYGFKIVRYQPQRALLEQAQREDYQYGVVWSFTPLSLGKRTGSLLTMNVTGKKENRMEYIKFAYDYVNNYIRVVEYCLKTEGLKECRNYPYTKRL